MSRPPPSAPWPPLAGLLLAALAVAGCGEPARGTRIVLVTLDTLRWDSLAGPSRAMPRLAQAAEEGLVFDRSYAATSSTQPTHATLFTGLHPWQHGVHRNGMVLDDATLTLAEELDQAGWWTGAVVASFPLHSRFGYAQGFDDFRDAFSAGNRRRDWNDVEIEDGAFWTPGAEITPTALELLDHAEGQRQFLWVHYFDAHAPYGDSQGWRVQVAQLTDAARERSPGLNDLIRQAREAYDADVGHIDRQLGQLLDRLDADADRFDTHVIVTADHGESFGDDGSFDHGKRLTPAQVHVPLVILSPGLSPDRRVEPNGTIDVWATLRALAGLPPQPGRGRDLRQPPAGTPSALGMRRTYVEPREDVRVDGSVVLVGETEQFYWLTEAGQLIGNAAGIEEGDRIVPPEALQAARSLFALFEQELAGLDTTELLDEETQRRLEALGYTR
jgi:arylsulfatase A-like enzyme